MVDDVFTVRIPGHPALEFPWWGCLLLALAGLGFVAYVGMVMNTFFPRMCACRPRKKKLHGKGPATDVLYLTMSGLKPCHRATGSRPDRLGRPKLASAAGQHTLEPRNATHFRSRSRSPGSRAPS